MSHVEKLSKTKWRARWRTPDGAHRSKVFKRKEEADNYLTTVDKTKHDGVYVDRSAGAERLDAYAARWIQTRRTRDGQPLRPRTKALYVQLVDSHIAPTLGASRLRDVTPETVREWHASLPGTAAPSKCYRLLRAIFTTAVEDGKIVRNPCMVKHAAVERAPVRPMPTGDEVWALADAIEPRYRALVLTAAFVGLRWGELVGLRRGDIDCERRVVRITRSMIEVDGKVSAGPPKTAAGVRTVAVPPAVMVALEAHLAAYVADDDAAAVFVGPKGATPRRSNFNAVWSRARVVVGREDLHLHDLRHYASTLAASAGASTKELMSRLGHSSPAAALRYQHATSARDEIIAARMDELAADTRAREGVALRVVRGR
jgi:integrase